MFFQNAYIGRNRWWRWGITLIGVIFVQVLASMPLVAYVASEAGKLGIEYSVFLTRLPEDADRNIILALFLLPFFFTFLALWFFIRWLHKKPLRAVLTGRTRFDWKRMLVAFTLWFVIFGGTIFVFLPAGTYTFQFDAEKFLPLVLVAFALIPLQASTEELFFRGYLMQGFSLLVKNKIGSLGIVTVLFVLAHMSNPEFASGSPLFLLDYVLMSVFLGLIAILDDGLEISCGIHAANNIFLTAVFNVYNGTFQTDALLQTNPRFIMDVSTYSIVIPYVVAFIILFVVYRWRFATLFVSTKPLEQALQENATAKVQHVS